MYRSRLSAAARRAICVVVWIVGLPLRIAFVSVLGPIALIGVPLFLLMDAHSWACNDEDFEGTFWKIPKSLWWDFLVMGRFEL